MSRSHSDTIHFHCTGSESYVCRVCKSIARDPKDEGHGLIDLCATCYEREGLRNEHTDGHHVDRFHPNCEDCDEDKAETAMLQKQRELGND